MPPAPKKIKSKSTKSKKKKIVLSAEQKAENRRKAKIHSLIKAIFKSMGFEYFNTDGKDLVVGKTSSEIDNIFVYKNIILVCEETISHAKEHLRKKNEFYQDILQNKQQLIDFLKNKFPERAGNFIYSAKQCYIFYIYCSETKIEEDTQEEYSSIKYLDLKSLEYFKVVTSSIKLSSINEFFKYLNLDLSQVGDPSSDTVVKDIQSAVILPEASSGLPDGVQLITFVMKASDLMDCSYVFRKDSWNGGSNSFYQRLIIPSKVESIRKFLAHEKRTFIDNIIVSLPADVKFSRIVNDVEIAIPDMTLDGIKLESLIIKVPYKINSIGIIDGQHRVFGHYRGMDTLEPVIEDLRNKRHLLVTGLYYDKTKFSEQEKRKFESSLFLQINSKHKGVEPALLQYIENLKTPNSSVGIAWAVISGLNNRSPFLGEFVMSPLDKTGIKIPTIIKYGLKDLVELNDNKETFYKYWTDADKSKIVGEKFDSDKLDEYIKFCARSLSMYFNAVKDNFPKTLWTLNNKESRLLSVTSMVAFFQAFSFALEEYKVVKDQPFYKGKLSTLPTKIDFAAKSFPYVSSQWPDLVKIIKSCWT